MDTGDESLLEATYTVKSMAKPKRGQSTAAIDNHVGGRIRDRRIMLGLTQQQLAEVIGVTYQHAHKAKDLCADCALRAPLPSEAHD